ncbi:MAG: DNA-directed RNA polymerase subunit alpha [Cytophagales bacterium]|nr:DNA-directed RNA polymerase subunit alpha [Cytophagales bacterium]
MNEDVKIINGVVLPASISYVNNDSNKSTFTIKPLSSGFGTTLGNTLRRVLLSYVEGYAINYIKIPGVKHEFSTIDGVIEDVLELVLNLKQVRFKKKGKNQNENIKVNLDKTVFCAGDIDKFSTNFEIVNKDFEICHFDSQQHFEIELNVVSGEGWKPAKEMEPGKDEIGTIFIDSIFAPVKNVSINVSDTRVGQEIGYDALEISITTDGSLTPLQALNIAIEKIKDIFVFLLDPKLYSPKAPNNLDSVDIQKIRIEKLLNTPIETLGLSRRTYSTLINFQKVYTLKDLLVLKESDIEETPNFGAKSMKELKEFLANNNLSFGMDLEKYKI